MWSLKEWGRGLALSLLLIPGADASHHFGGHGRYVRGPHGIPAALGGLPGWGRYSPPYYETIGANGLPLAYVPPFLTVNAGGIFPAMLPFAGGSVGWNGGGVAGPWPPPQAFPPFVEARPKPKKPDPTRSAQLVTFGDRLFRARNSKRAGERYEQAARADPTSAVPRIRLAQVALLRGHYAEAAHQLREAVAVDPGWLARATDIQTIYAEPADFARQIARLESHLQAEPNDRDAWLVLGAQWFLSGRTQKAADVFLRLSDRQPDPTLALFLEASQPVARAGR